MNKLIYGGWAFDEAINPAMNPIANFVKKTDFEKGIVPFK